MHEMIFLRRCFSTRVVPRRRRCLFNVPGSDDRKLAKIPTLNADCLVLDLEDGVPLSKKEVARSGVLKTLNAGLFGDGQERAVRINSVGSGFETRDLETMYTIHVESPDHVKFVSSLIDQLAPSTTKDRIRLLVSIESAFSLLNVAKIASCDTKIDALIFASEDYCADTGIHRTESLTELLYARSAVVTAAKAYGLQAIDMVCIDYKSEARLQFESENAVRMGFSGKQAIHPAQIASIQQAFCPSESQVHDATQIVELYKTHSKQGVGAFEFKGKVVDLPVVKAALRVLVAAGIKTEL